MAKYTKLIFITAFILLALGSFTLLKRNKNKVSFELAKNEVVIDNFEMGKVLDEQNNFYRVTAKRAKMNRDDGTAYLTDFSAYYKKDKVNVELHAPEGYLEQDFIVKISGKMTGKINDFDFSTGDKSNFHYDFLIGLGTFLGRATVENKKGHLSADKILVFSKNNYAEFIGHVRVIYKK